MPEPIQTTSQFANKYADILDIIMNEHSQENTTSGQKPEIKTTSQLVNKYADILDDIARLRTQGSYTYHGVLSCFLNEWLEMQSPDEEEDWDTQEEIYNALQESIDREIDHEVFYGTDEKETRVPEPFKTYINRMMNYPSNRPCGCGGEYIPPNEEGDE